MYITCKKEQQVHKRVSELQFRILKVKPVAAFNPKKSLKKFSTLGQKAVDKPSETLRTLGLC